VTASVPTRTGARVLRALRTAPSARDGLELLLAAATLALLAGSLGLGTGLLVPGAWDLAPASALSLLLVPALGEELVFRGAAVPDRTETPRAAFPIAASTLLFVLWHPVAAYTLAPEARPLLTRPDFLACAALLGLLCAVLRRRSGSVWPAVALHWAAVVVWKGWLGGPA